MRYCTCDNCKNEHVIEDLLPKIIFNDKNYFFDIEKGYYFDDNDRPLIKLDNCKCFFCKRGVAVKQKDFTAKNNYSEIIDKRIAALADKIKSIKESYQRKPQ